MNQITRELATTRIDDRLREAATAHHPRAGARPAASYPTRHRLARGLHQLADRLDG